MLLGQILVVCLLLIGSHGNMSPDSKITCSKGQSDAVSLSPRDRSKRKPRGQPGTDPLRIGLQATSTCILDNH